jgi:predicted RNA binding protein YcfA (HicA-like mRNA interferase family)
MVYHLFMTAREVIKALKAAGWQVVRQKGSHVILSKDGRICPVPDHGKKDLKPGTLASIKRITGVET